MNWLNSSKIQNEMLVIRIKTIIEDLKESIKAVIVCRDYPYYIWSNPTFNKSSVKC